MSKSKAIGTAAETAVVRYLRANGFPYAERRALAGATDLGDVIGTPGVCWEIKGGAAAETAGDGLIAEWLQETDQERINSGSDYGVLVVKRKGIGPANCGAWWAIVRGKAWVNLLDAATHRHTEDHRYPVRVHLASMCDLLRSAGYGDPHPQAGAA